MGLWSWRSKSVDFSRVFSYFYLIFTTSGHVHFLSVFRFRMHFSICKPFLWFCETSSKTWFFVPPCRPPIPGIKQFSICMILRPVGQKWTYEKLQDQNIAYVMFQMNFYLHADWFSMHIYSVLCVPPGFRKWCFRKKQNPFFYLLDLVWNICKIEPFLAFNFLSASYPL